MARQVLPWVGAAVGFMIGGPAGAQWGFAIGGIVGNAVDPQVIQGPKLGEGQDNTASEGGFRPIVLGKGAVGVCMIHEGPLKKRTIRHRQSKGGGPVTEEERAYRTMAFALGESAYPEAGVQLLRLWIDNKLRYDVTPTSQIVVESSQFAEKFTFYPGDETQQPDPDIEAFLGAGNVPSYRGGSPYIVFPDWDVTDSRGMAPMIKAELASDVVGSNVYVAYNTHQIVYRSLDLKSWTPSTSVGLGGTFYAFTSAGDGRLIAATAGAAKYSTDGGQSWGNVVGVPSGVPSDIIYSEFSGLYLFSYINGGDVRKSSDGVNLEPIAGVPSGSMYQGACRGQVVIFGSHNASVYRSMDGGHSFPQRFDLGLFLTQGTDHVIATDTHFIVALSNGRIFRSISGAHGTWDESSVPSPRSGAAIGLAASDDGKYVAMVCINGDTFLSSNRGSTFSRVASFGSGGGALPNARHLAFHRGKFLLAAEQYLRTLDPENPTTWTVEFERPGQAGTWAVKAPAVIDADKASLRDIIGWLHARVDVADSKYEVSSLSDDVEGVVFADGYTVADAVRTLMALYFFDAGEFNAGGGYRINYVKRGGAAMTTLTEDDIVEGPEDWEREDSYERPRVLHVAYQNPVADYGAPNIVIKRTSPDVLVTGERSLSVPVVFSDVDEITQRADVMMTVAYTEIAGTYEIVLPDTWLELAPTVPIGFGIRGKVRRLRMTEWRYVDGVIKSKWMADRQSAYTSNLTGLPVVPTTPPPPSIVGPTVSVVLDIPALVDSMDSLHMLVAASGQTPAWYGSVHQIKPPFEIDFATAAVFSGISTIMGLLQDDVTAASQHYTDTTNVVRVTLYSDDELQTYTQQQFLAENGAFALAYDYGGIRRWEILQYRDAVKVGDHEWEMTTLARGRLNTEAAAHPAGSIFVLLDAGLRTIPAQTAWLGEDIDHRAVSYGQLPDQAVPYTETYTGESQREFPVAHLFGKIDGDDLILSCVPRHRFGTDDHPVQSINHDGYAWTATDGSNIAEATTVDPVYTFDVTGWATPITVTVAQLNRITGAGPTVSESIE